MLRMGSFTNALPDYPPLRDLAGATIEVVDQLPGTQPSGRPNFEQAVRDRPVQTHGRQFAVGLSAWSMIKTLTEPFSEDSFNPSCSGRATKMLGAASGGGGWLP